MIQLAAFFQFSILPETEIVWFEYIPQKYNQKTSENFISHLSILDFIFNHGKNTENIFI